MYQVGNNKKSYTMMHGQPNIKIAYHVDLTIGGSFSKNLSVLSNCGYLG